MSRQLLVFNCEQIKCIVLHYSVLNSLPDLFGTKHMEGSSMSKHLPRWDSPEQVSAAAPLHRIHY